jgi:hypothetical protein
MLVGFAEGLGAPKTYATREHYDIDVNRELPGLGAANCSAACKQTAYGRRGVSGCIPGQDDRRHACPNLPVDGTGEVRLRADADSHRGRLRRHLRQSHSGVVESMKRRPARSRSSSKAAA